MRQVVANNGNWLTVRPKKWPRSLTGGGRLLEIPTVRLWLGKFWCFWLTVACRRLSLTRDDRTWRFDCIWFYFLTNKIFVYDNHCSHSLKKPFVIALILDSDIKFKNICSQEMTKLLGNVNQYVSKGTASNFIALNSSNVGNFLWILILKDSIKVQEKKKKVVVLCSLHPQNMKLGIFTS